MIHAIQLVFIPSSIWDAIHFVSFLLTKALLKMFSGSCDVEKKLKLHMLIHIKMVSKIHLLCKTPSHWYSGSQDILINPQMAQGKKNFI